MSSGHLSLLTLLCYPLLLHAAIVSGHALVGLTVGLVLLVCWWLDGWLTRAGVVAAIIFVSAWIHYQTPELTLPVAFALPVMINVVHCAGFVRSLRRGVTPIVTEVAARIRGHLPPKVAWYGRRVTWMWTVFFALCAVETALLAWLAPLEVWSLFATVLNNVFAGVLFVCEYIARRHVLSELDHPGFLSFVRSLWQSGLRRAPGSSA